MIIRISRIVRCSIPIQQCRQLRRVRSVIVSIDMFYPRPIVYVIHTPICSQSYSRFSLHTRHKGYRCLCFPVIVLCKRSHCAVTKEILKIVRHINAHCIATIGFERCRENILNGLIEFLKRKWFPIKAHCRSIPFVRLQVCSCWEILQRSLCALVITIIGKPANKL